MRVLVVDEDAAHLDAMRRGLSGRFDITACTDAQDALACCESSRFEVLLLGDGVLDAAGTDWLPEARSRQPNAWRVVMGSSDNAGDLLSAIDCGDVHRVLERPVTAEALLETVEGLRRQTQPGMSLCTIADADSERAMELAEQLYGTGEFLALPDDDAGVSERRPALVLVVEPGSPQDVERRVAELGAHERAVPVFVALPLDADYDAASYLSAGADDVLWMPLRPEELALRYRTWRARQYAHREAERVRTELLAQQPFPHIIGRSGPMQRVFEWVHRVAGTDSSVLFLGETGSGKELLARAVHSLSPRRDAPFVAVNLSALPETLIESELFGHERGAFTGATERRRGRIEEAQGGSLFLDEIGDLNLSSQVKLLRVLEERRFSRVGSNEELDADFRLICATHRNLDEMVGSGEFREDLYYRINVVRIDLPPLRERTDDIPALAQHFLERHREQAGSDGVTLSEEAVEALKRHDWPGNVRELEHMIERAVALSRDGETIGPDLIQARPRRRSFRDDISSFWTSGRGLREVLEDIERHILVETLQRYDGNRVAAAKKLKIPRQTLQNRLRKLGIDL